MSDTYMSAFRARASELEWTDPPSPWTAASQWEDFVSVVAQGYDDNIYEYENDLSIRGRIDKVLPDSTLSTFSDHEDFHKRISKADSQFRSACHQDILIRSAGDPWWERLVPIHASRELLDDIQRLFGVTL